MLYYLIILLAYLGSPAVLALDKLGWKPIGRSVMDGIMFTALIGILTLVFLLTFGWFFITWVVAHVQIV